MCDFSCVSDVSQLARQWDDSAAHVTAIQVQQVNVLVFPELDLDYVTFFLRRARYRSGKKSSAPTGVPLDKG